MEPVSISIPSFVDNPREGLDLFSTCFRVVAACDSAKQCSSGWGDVAVRPYLPYSELLEALHL